MNTCKKINRSAAALAVVCGVVLILMLLCNRFMPMVADDFSYSYSWATGERIRSIGDIIGSLRVHYRATNGRVIAHFFAQLFLWLPRILFQFCNAGIFLLLMLLMYRLCRLPGRHSALLLAVLFGLVWCATPEFGQVYLWLDGACNYLWSGFFTLLYLAPLLRSLIEGTELSRHPGRWVSTMLLGFAAGAYLENVSAAAIFMAALLMVLVRFWGKRNLPLYWPISFVLSIAGYLSMMLAPGEMKNKVGTTSLVVLRHNFMDALNMLKLFWPLLLVLGILAILSVYYGCSKGRLLAAGVLFLGSMAANFVFIFAAYYPTRASFYTVLLLVLAIGVLLPELMDSASALPLACAVWALLLITSYQALLGLNDIYEVYGTFRSNEAIIAEAKAEGQLDVVAVFPKRDTQYAYASYYEPDPNAWPNPTIARYYGLNSIVFQ